MNRVDLVGRLASKPELKQTPNGIATTRFILAVNRPFTGADGNREADFIPIRVWRKSAENVCQFLDKGSLVSAEGRIQTNSFTDKNGNKQYTWEVVVDTVQFLERKNTSKQQETKTPKETVTDEQVDIYAEFGENVVDEDDFLD